jgi:hypothetical protein
LRPKKKIFTLPHVVREEFEQLFCRVANWFKIPQLQSALSAKQNPRYQRLAVFCLQLSRVSLLVMGKKAMRINWQWVAKRVLASPPPKPKVLPKKKKKNFKIKILSQIFLFFF